MFLHSRILLFKPIRTRCCLVTEPESLTGGSLKPYLLEHCISESVSAAPNTISAVQQHQAHDISMLPAWWFRVLYTHMAAMALGLLTLRLDQFPRSATHTVWRTRWHSYAHDSSSKSFRACKMHVALRQRFCRTEQTQSIPSSPLLFNQRLPNNQCLSKTKALRTTKTLRMGVIRIPSMIFLLPRWSFHVQYRRHTLADKVSLNAIRS